MKDTYQKFVSLTDTIRVAYQKDDWVDLHFSLLNLMAWVQRILPEIHEYAQKRKVIQ